MKLATIVKYARPVSAFEASLTFTVVDDRDDRSLIQAVGSTNPFVDWSVQPQEVVADADLVRADVANLADAFVEQLRMALTLIEIDQVRALNAKQTNPGICHSADFVDSNEYMLAAWDSLPELGAMDLQNEQHIALWNDAWQRAKGLL